MKTLLPFRTQPPDGAEPVPNPERTRLYAWNEADHTNENWSLEIPEEATGMIKIGEAWHWVIEISDDKLPKWER